MKGIFLLFTMLMVTTSLFAQQWTTSGSNIYNSNTGNVGVGTTSPSTKFHIEGGTNSEPLKITSNNLSTSLGLYTAGSSDILSAFVSYRSRGTVQSPANVLANDRIGGFYGRPYLNSGYQHSVAIEMYVGLSPSSTSYPTYIVFGTTPNGSTVRQDRMKIAEDGNVGIGTTTPAYKLDVLGTANATNLRTSTFQMTGGSPGAGKVLTCDASGNATWQPAPASQWTSSGSNINYTTPGVVSIGTNIAPAGYKLAVGGKIVAEEVVVKLQANWPDYVFGNEYKLLSLSELERFIITNKHLPEIPSASEIKTDGLKVGEMEALLLKKIEELTIYLIEADKRIDILQQKLNDLNSK